MTQRVAREEGIDIALLLGKLKAITSAFIHVHNELAAAGQSITKLTTSNSRHKSRITGLRGDVGSLESTITVLRETVGSFARCNHLQSQRIPYLEASLEAMQFETLNDTADHDAMTEALKAKIRTMQEPHQDTIDELRALEIGTQQDGEESESLIASLDPKLANVKLFLLGAIQNTRTLSSALKAATSELRVDVDLAAHRMHLAEMIEYEPLQHKRSLSGLVLRQGRQPLNPIRKRSEGSGGAKAL